MRLERHVRFSEVVAKKLACYVYRLIDPRTGITFYVGRGQGKRVFSHAAGKWKPNGAEDEETLKLKTIRAIKNAGFQVEHVIHRHGLDKRTAREVESALIDAYPGLTNILRGDESSRGVMHTEEVIRLYEAPQADFRHKLILVWVNDTSDDRELIDAARYAWRVSPDRANKAQFVLAVRRGLIIGAFRVKGRWLKATLKNFPSFPLVAEGKYGFRGHDAPENIKKLYLQKRVLRSYGASFRYVNC